MTPTTGPWQLRDLQGEPRNVWFDDENYGDHSGAWLNPRYYLGEANDDFWLLMGDATRINAPSSVFTLSGLEPGWYDVYTYAVSPAGFPARVEVTVSGAITQNPQICTGPMPRDWVLVRGVTHTVHRVYVRTGTIGIRVDGPPPHSFINGFQIVKLQ